MQYCHLFVKKRYLVKSDVFITLTFQTSVKKNCSCKKVIIMDMKLKQDSSTLIWKLFWALTLSCSTQRLQRGSWPRAMLLFFQWPTVITNPVLVWSTYSQPQPCYNGNTNSAMYVFHLTMHLDFFSLQNLMQTGVIVFVVKSMAILSKWYLIWYCVHIS